MLDLCSHEDGSQRLSNPEPANIQAKISFFPAPPGATPCPRINGCAASNPKEDAALAPAGAASSFGNIFLMLCAKNSNTDYPKRSIGDHPPHSSIIHPHLLHPPVYIHILSAKLDYNQFRNAIPE
jgi:hypothetical protein